MSEIVVNVTDPGSYAVSVEGATPTTATVSNGGGVTVSLPGADVAWGDLVGLPAEFPPEDHVHEISDVNGLQAAIDGKAAASHAHEIADVTGLQAALDGKADAGHVHSYPVTSVNGLTGDVVIEAGGGGAELSDSTPLPLGTADPGTGVLASRADHVHALPTATDIGALDSDSVIDGGDYVGELLYTITITAQPQDASVDLPATATWSYTLAESGQITGATRSLVAARNSGSAGTAFPLVLNQSGVWAMSGGAATWSLSARTFSQDLNAATMASGFGNGRWVCVDAKNFISYTATANPYTASSWTETTNNGFSSSTTSSESYYIKGGQRRIAYANNVFLASSATSLVTYNPVGFTWGNSNLMASADGATWTARTLHPLDPAGSAQGPRVEAIVVSEAGRLVACGAVITDSTNNTKQFRVSYSDDSFAWTLAALPSTVSGISDTRRAVAAFGNGKYVVLPNHQLSRAFVSTDGVTWTQHTGPSFEALDLDFDGEFFVAVGSDAYATSSDGVTWTNRSAPVGGWSECCVVGNTTYALHSAAETLRIEREVETGTGQTSFSVTAVSNSSPLSYQWQSSSDSGSTWATVSAADGSSLSIAAITASFTGRQYRVIVSAPDADSVTSAAATLTVT